MTLSFFKDLAVRLVNNHNSHNYEGRVEVYHSGQWGTICGSQWDIHDGDVVCKQLGYRGAVRIWSYNHFGRGTGRVWNSVGCRGNETNLAECDFSGWGAGYCRSYRNSAGVTCSSSEYLFLIWSLAKINISVLPHKHKPTKHTQIHTKHAQKWQKKMGNHVGLPLCGHIPPVPKDLGATQVH